jgi:hypothetical protein
MKPNLKRSRSTRTECFSHKTQPSPRRSAVGGAQVVANILVTGSDPSVTDYILEMPAKCPQCRREILEKTLV